LVEGGGAKSGFEAGYAEQVVLSEGDAFEGKSFLRVDGLIDGDEVGAEAVNRVAVLDLDDGEVDAGEPVFAGVLRGPGFACGVRGPVKFWALARLAASCLSVIALNAHNG
jgi:hypothetical protein